MCSNDRTIDDRADIVYLKLELSEDGCPMPFARPVREPIVNALPRAKAFGKIAPWDSRLGAVEHGVDELPIASRRPRSVSLFREYPSQTRPLLVGKFVTPHVLV